MPLSFLVSVVNIVVMYFMIALLSALYEHVEFFITDVSISHMVGYGVSSISSKTVSTHI